MKFQYIYNEDGEKETDFDLDRYKGYIKVFRIFS